MILGVPLPLSGRYAAQGAQAHAGLVLWARWAGAQLAVEDDQSRPERAASLYRDLAGRCELVLGPYGSDSVRAVAHAGSPAPLWNHGGAADDVQQLPGVISVPSPSSCYLVALARAVALLRPRCSVALATAPGAFARFAREGLERGCAESGLTPAGVFSLSDPPDRIAAGRPQAVLLCGPVERELPLFRSLRSALPSALLGGVSPGLRVFPALLGADPGGLLAPCQWHPEVPVRPELGPTSMEVLADARAAGLGPVDYVAAQAFATALLAVHCRELSPDDSLAVALALRSSTFFGGFALDPETRLQSGHRLCVVRWSGLDQELLLANAS
jgi:ABC-type branched-subunit amino acid transport system substrate-binding protein